MVSPRTTWASAFASAAAQILEHVTKRSLSVVASFSCDNRLGVMADPRHHRFPTLWNQVPLNRTLEALLPPARASSFPLAGSARLKGRAGGKVPYRRCSSGLEGAHVFHVSIFGMIEHLRAEVRREPKAQLQPFNVSEVPGALRVVSRRDLHAQKKVLA
jgi:hypothetical protein